MNNYFDVKILADDELPATMLINALYAKLHKALYDLDSTNIGVSFPAYKVTLGDMLRIHGTKAVLEQLQAKNWIGFNK